MWMSVDRVENGIVVMIAEGEQAYHWDVTTYEAAVGQAPEETHILWCEVQDHTIISARFDPHETQRRANAAHERLQRLIQKSSSKNNRKG
ncbi:MAG: hypothetical protein E7661_07945 [Ruminococcaceae bacterium]|nr:hypothetical protein [Oscillospiraceae bacterium]